ncbi:hypothetical protein SK128_006704 [Halocaridina rubra]|uniref:Pentraxin (PTX) domain-containing protein n=1 Tax=Halocaridina rubra TaxID=373956 RepID=A0AAN8WI48_HALRR
MLECVLITLLLLILRSAGVTLQERTWRDLFYKEGRFLVTVTSLLSYSGRANSVMVLKLQGDRKAASDTIAYYEGDVDRSRQLNSVTLCARFRLFILHTCAVFFCMKDTQNENSAMLAGGKRLEGTVLPATWYHICFTYDHEKTIISTYMDGELNNHQMYDIGENIFGDNVTIGQSDKKTSQKSFSGELTQVNVWDRALSEEDIKDMATCKHDIQGNYVSWERGWTLHKISSHQIPLEKLCQKDIGIKRFWFPTKPFSTALYLCQALGTHLPLGVPVLDIGALNKLIPQGLTDRCYNRYWTSLMDENEEGFWKYYSGHNESLIIWDQKEPNGLQYENCAIATDKGLHDVDCKGNLECIICSFEGDRKFSFLGTCEDELRNQYFVAKQNNISELHFMGYGNYYIRKQAGRWTWVDDVYGRVIAKMEIIKPNFPMGRRWWKLEESVCGQKPGTQRQLLLSPCRHDQFTCSDATCVPHENRCDLKYDCKDNSDEVDCNTVAFPEDYQYYLPPRISREEGINLLIKLNIIVEFLSLKTMDMQLEAVFVMSLTWEDSRLHYQNLKESNTLNILSNDTVKRLWIPTVSFVNTNGNHRTLADDGAIMFINRHTGVMERDKGAPGEGIADKVIKPLLIAQKSWVVPTMDSVLTGKEVDIYPGAGNTLTIKRKYGVVFKCDLNLQLYPFDKQECKMHLQIISAPRSFLQFDTDSSSVINIGETFLTEYHVGTLDLTHDLESEFSEATVRIPLERLQGYAILNIYIPTLVLLIISYVTLYFRPIIFDTRMMAALTVQLVIATLFSQNHQATAFPRVPKPHHDKFIIRVDISN